MKLEGSFDTNLTPRIKLALAQSKSINIVVDTGFNGELVLPKSLLKESQFELGGTIEVELADGSEVKSEWYEGSILWFDEMQTVRAIATKSDDALLGTQMLTGCRLILDLDKNDVVLEKK